jgi:hypothetical protein
MTHPALIKNIGAFDRRTQATPAGGVNSAISELLEAPSPQRTSDAMQLPHILFKILKPRARVITFLLILILLILLFPCPRAAAQSISYGLGIGTPLNNLATADNSRVATTMRFTLGLLFSIKSKC